MNHEHITTYPPRSEHVPQSHELAIEGLKRQISAQRERDAIEQETALKLANKIRHDLD